MDANAGKLKDFLKASDDKQYEGFPDYVIQKLSSGNCTPSQKKYIKNIPWQSSECSEIDLIQAKKILEESHYGMQDVKQQILRYIACQKHLGHAYGDVLLLVGPPGVGKTSIAKAVAQAMNRKFVKIPLAGVSDAGPLRGYDTNYKNPKPSLIIEGIIEAKTLSPLVLLDEIDKMGGSEANGDPEHVLLHVLDSDRTSFVDDFIEIPIDLSNIVFLATANSIKSISPILVNRVNIINLNGYTKDEKIKIATDYIVPSLIEELSVTEFNLYFSHDLIEYLVDTHAHEPGIRSLKRSIKLFIETIIMETYLGNQIPPQITISEYKQLMHLEPLRQPKFRHHKKKSKKNYYNY